MMKRLDIQTFGLSLFAACLLACACTQGPSKGAMDGAMGNSDATAGTVVATIGDKKVTLGELDEHVGAQLRELDDQKYQARRSGLDQIINEELVKKEAKKKGITEEQYLKTEVESKITQPTDQQIQQFFAQNASQLPPNAKLADYKDRIVTFLNRQAHTDRAKELFNELRKDGQVSVSLAPPAKPRMQVEAKGPARGPTSTKVTIVEFSDFECPFCSRARDTVDKVMQHYDGKVRLVFRQFPLSFHAHARKAAEASLCANEQNKFWEMHNAMFGDQSKLEPAALKETAAKLGLDKAKFNTCLDTGSFAKTVEEDMAAAEKVGVTGTPAFFINGISLSGAQPVEEFDKIIDQELAAK